MGVEAEAGRFEMTVWVTEGEDGELSVRWSYDPELYGRERVERMQGHYRRLLEAAVAQPEIRLSKLKALVNVEPRAEAVEAGENQSSSLKKLLGMKRKAVNLSRPATAKTAYPKLDEAILPVDQAPINITT
jgi:hypothetical protein